MNKIIIREIVRQKKLLDIQSGARTMNCPITIGEILARIVEHKLSLINLKEYLEGILQSAKNNRHGGDYDLTSWKESLEEQLEKDIQELNKLIDKY